MKEIQHILSHVRSAVEKYDMIHDGDKIAVGVSAGKDSLTLLCALANLRRFFPKKFDLMAITIDMGFELLEPDSRRKILSDDGKTLITPAEPAVMNLEPVKNLCETLDVEYHIVKTQIAHIIFDIRKESNPCSLCARMRRGSLHDAAREFGCNKVALGHHFDDIVETFMLNLFFEGRLGCFQPVTYLSRADLYLIRPLIHTPEKEIKYFAKKAGLPVIESPCPSDGTTERAKMKEYLAQFDREHGGLYHRIAGAINRAGIDGFKE